MIGIKAGAKVRIRDNYPVENVTPGQDDIALRGREGTVATTAVALPGGVRVALEGDEPQDGLFYLEELEVLD